MSRPGPAARQIALAAICDRAGNVTAHLNRLLSPGEVPAQEAALARELALGVVRRRGTLDAVILAFQRGRAKGLPKRVRAVLRLGLYQLLFLDRVPAFAAVNEAVEQIGPRRRGMRAFVNAVLRNVARSLSAPQAGSPEAGRDVLPVARDCFRRFDRPVFADPATDAAGYLAGAYSLPKGLAVKWLTDLGPFDAVRRLACHANSRPPLILRVNALRGSVEEALAELRAGGVEVLRHANGLSVVLPEGADVRSLSVFTQGKVQPQDAAASSVIAEADVAAGMRVLDLCASPGTKTTHLAERMEDSGEVLAVDVTDEKLARVRENCDRMGVSIVRTLRAEQVGDLPQASFDLVLVDAPCSNTGVLARRPEARWRFSRRRLRALAADQRDLLGLALKLVRPGGTCVYATCSMETEENEEPARAAAHAEAGAKVFRDKRIHPSGWDDPAGWSDGGYFAVLRR